MKLSVVIPAFNEERNIKSGALEQVRDYLNCQNYKSEVLIVDDGSLDKTVSLVEERINSWPEFRLIKNPHGGKAITVMTGLLAAKGEIVVFTDMDQATPINQIEKFFPKFEAGYDIVIGKRNARNGAPLLRQGYALGFVILRNLILGLPFSDTQCGFKAFKKETILKLFPQLLSFWQGARSSGAAVNAGFDIEMLYLAKKINLRVAEVLVEWHHVRSERVGIKAGLEAIKDMFRIRINSILGKYD